jgi:hypothetical protein
VLTLLRVALVGIQLLLVLLFLVLDSRHAAIEAIAEALSPLCTDYRVSSAHVPPEMSLARTPDRTAVCPDHDRFGLLCFI